MTAKLKRKENSANNNDTDVWTAQRDGLAEQPVKARGQQVSDPLHQPSLGKITQCEEDNNDSSCTKPAENSLKTCQYHQGQTSENGQGSMVQLHTAECTCKEKKARD